MSTTEELQAALVAAPAVAPGKVPSPCPVCGAYSLAPDSEVSALLAVCDVLSLKTLEALGKFIVRAERSRYRAMATRPWYVAHTLWQPEAVMVEKALRSAWDVVPAMIDTHGGCGASPAQITRMLDAYITDLAITGTEHDVAELRYRFEAHLGLPVYGAACSEPQPAQEDEGEVEQT